MGVACIRVGCEGGHVLDAKLPENVRYILVLDAARGIKESAKNMVGAKIEEYDFICI